jgi:SAM-dependent methyltransferase
LRNILSKINGRFVYQYRIENLTSTVLKTLPDFTSLLDVGCGHALISKKIIESRSSVSVSGVDVLRWGNPSVPVDLYDGKVLPYSDNSFDVVMLLDCVHHAEDPFMLLSESSRVAKKFILIKDHLCENKFHNRVLSFMDRVGNSKYGIDIPENYWSRKQWLDAANKLNWNQKIFTSRFKYYPWPVSWVFGGSLHFIALFELSDS